MNKLLKIVCLISLIAISTTCSNKVVIHLKNETVPVVHFIFDPFEENYYALVTKSGLSEGSILSDRDSAELFYPNQIDLKLELWNDSVRLWYTTFHEVDANKELGFFPQGSGYLYQADQLIPKKETSFPFLEPYPEFSYFRILLAGEDFTRDAYSRVPFAAYPVITQPHFADQKVRLYGPAPLIIGWESYQNIRYFDFYFLVHYEEVDRYENSMMKNHQFLYAQDVQLSGERYSLSLDPDHFLKRLAASFPAMNDGINYRKFKSFDAVLVGGDDNFESYLRHQKNGAESSLRPWTNITNGLGVFAIKYKTIKSDFRFHSESKDSLAMGQYTKNLGFVRW